MKHVCLLSGLLLLASPVLGQTYTGALSAEDLTLQEGEYYDAYSFQAETVQRFTIRMTSSAFDTYLVVRSPGGSAFENDDFEEQASQLEVVTTEPGVWSVLATSYGPGATGDYELVITPGPTGQMQVIEGRLDNRDAVALKGEYYDTHTLPLGDDDVTFELVSLGFDGYLVVTSPSGQVWRIDERGPSTPEHVGPFPGERGTWTVQVTSAQQGEVGAYDLRVVTFAE